MPFACLLLVAVAFALCVPLTALARGLGKRLNALDSAGVSGQVKTSRRAVPNTGGIAIVASIALPMIAGLAVVALGATDQLTSLVPELRAQIPGILKQADEAIWLLGGAVVLHVLGVVDDRRPLSAAPKLAVMVGVALAVVIATQTRLLTAVDTVAPFGGLPILSTGLTVIWFVAVTNAINFMDNMDGLCAGVVAVAGSFFLVAGIVNHQWFVAATLALVVGACVGFLVFNFPFRVHSDADGRPVGGASIFMGDGGSLVLGYLLAFLTARSTYFGRVEAGGEVSGPPVGSQWFGVFMPLIVLAVPLYDFVSVTTIRLAQGRSPFVGDLQHFSHRLVRRGLSRRCAVVVIYGFTAVTSIGGVSLASLAPWQAALVGFQTVLVLLVLAMFEWKSPAAREETLRTGPPS